MIGLIDWNDEIAWFLCRLKDMILIFQNHSWSLRLLHSMQNYIKIEFNWSKPFNHFISSNNIIDNIHLYTVHTIKKNSFMFDIVHQRCLLLFVGLMIINMLTNAVGWFIHPWYFNIICYASSIKYKATERAKKPTT